MKQLFYTEEQQYHALASAIINQAVEDYKRADAYVARHQRDVELLEGKYERVTRKPGQHKCPSIVWAVYTMKEVKDFFYGKWFDLYCELDISGVDALRRVRMQCINPLSDEKIEEICAEWHKVIKSKLKARKSYERSESNRENNKRA